MEYKNEMVFSTDKFKEFIKRVFNDTKITEKVIKRAKGWTDECEGLTPEQMNELHYVSSDAWLVKK